MKIGIHVFELDYVPYFDLERSRPRTVVDNYWGNLGSVMAICVPESVLKNCTRSFFS